MSVPVLVSPISITAKSTDSIEGFWIKVVISSRTSAARVSSCGEKLISVWGSPGSENFFILVQTSLSNAGIVEIVGEHLDLNSVVIQCLVEHFVNLASSCVAEPDVHIFVSEIVSFLCPRLLRHVEKPVAGGLELGLSAIMVGVS